MYRTILFFIRFASFCFCACFSCAWFSSLLDFLLCLIFFCAWFSSVLGFLLVLERLKYQSVRARGSGDGEQSRTVVRQPCDRDCDTSS